ncbi:MAG TPA: glycosyltransferase [Gemmatimonadaceae bacterium]|nr:glycosyltransferase [Gemmatimonadaceae bacterium]
MARILILIGGPLWTNPRTQKEADVLADIGHEVSVGGVWFDSLSESRDRAIYAGKPWTFRPILDFRPRTLRGRIKNIQVRARTRAARELFKRLGLVLPAIHGYGHSEMLATALKLEAELTIVHSEAGLWVGDRLLDRNMNVGADFEDWFSEDLAGHDRALKPITRIKELERRHVRECAYLVTTSNALAKALAAEYESRTPATVYNVFPPDSTRGATKPGRDRVSSEQVSLHWFSQTIGPGRGLELLFESLRRVEVPCEIHLRGAVTAQVKAALQSQIPPGWRDRIYFHGTVSNEELPRRIAEHDVGLALESSTTRSRDLTITNKLFQYMQGGLAVIATATAGQREVFSAAPGIGMLVHEGNASELAGAITALVSDRTLLMKIRETAREHFNHRFSWAEQRAAIVGEVSRALA